MWPTKQSLEPYNTEYRIVWEDPSEPEECAKVTSPAPESVTELLQLGILPPVTSYWKLEQDEEQPDFVKHTRGKELLHDMRTIDAKERQWVLYRILNDKFPQDGTDGR